jgi:hypothetical protein
MKHGASADLTAGLAAALLLGLWGLTARADSPAKPPAKAQQVGVHILVALAAQEGAEVDTGCKELRKRLGPMHVGSLRTVQKRKLVLRVGQHGALALPTGDNLKILPITIIGQQLNLRVQVRGLVNTRLQTTSGRPLIVRGPRHKGGHLILQIVPEY